MLKTFELDIPHFPRLIKRMDKIQLNVFGTSGSVRLNKQTEQGDSRKTLFSYVGKF